MVLVAFIIEHQVQERERIRYGLIVIFRSSWSTREKAVGEGDGNRKSRLGTEEKNLYGPPDKSYPPPTKLNKLKNSCLFYQ